jgi:hypothetical protein
MLRVILLPILLILLLAATPIHAAEQTPSEVYLAYHNTLKSSFSDSAIWPFYLSSAREEFQRKFPPDLRGRAFYMMKTTSPREVRVVKEDIAGDTATLTLRPGPGGEDRLVGTASLAREGDAWKLEKVIWQQQ